MTVAFGKLKTFFKSRTVRIVLVALGALLLLLAIYKVFFGGTAKSGYVPTAQEERLIHLLNCVEGIKDTTVMITEEEGTAVGAVVMFEGEDGFLTRMRLRQIAASALNIGENAVVVYPSGAQ